MKRIIAALDPSPDASDVLRAAVDVASATGARLSLLRVVEGAGEMPESDEALVSAARVQLRDLARDVPASQIESLQAKTGAPWREICNAAETGDADLVVVGARRLGPFERALGTTAARVANNCDRSALVVRVWHRTPKRMLVAGRTLGRGACGAARRSQRTPRRCRVARDLRGGSRP
jgi:nucleotide-binding universal stress UspA family protein